jgi:hypothetical protein
VNYWVAGVSPHWYGIGWISEQGISGWIFRFFVLFSYTRRITMKMKGLCLAAVLSVFALPIMAQASLVTVNDGEEFDFDATNTYQFTGAFSNSNTIISYGVNLDEGENFDFVVTAPQEFYLISRLTTLPDFGGTGMMSPYDENGEPIIHNGETFVYPVHWNYFTGYTYWMTIAVDNYALNIINNEYGGSFPVGGVTNPNTAPVPVPAGIILLGSGLLGLIARRKRG